MKQSVIMVAVADHDWTLNVLQDACTLARETGSTIALVQMVPVQHHQWLGTELGYFLLTREDQQHFAEYEALLAEAGVEYQTTVFQYMSLTEAIVQATEHMHAQTIFAHLPTSIVPFWTKVRTVLLHRRLERMGCEWVSQPIHPYERLASLEPAAAH